MVFKLFFTTDSPHCSNSIQLQRAWLRPRIHRKALLHCTLQSVEPQALCCTQEITEKKRVFGHCRCQAMSTVGAKTILPGELQGALFDVDGTLVDSMPRFFPSWNEAGVDFGLTMSEETFYRLAGKPLPDMVQVLHEEQLGGPASDEFVAAYLKRKFEVHELRQADEGTPPIIQAVADIARAHLAAGIPICAATSGDRHHVEEHLNAAGLGDIFPSDKIVCAADLPKGRGKPQPDIWVAAAKVIGVDVKQCVAYEDSENGFCSAWRAGCEVVDVRDTEGYPLPDGLKAVMPGQRANRPWMEEGVEGAVEAATEEGGGGSGGDGADGKAAE